MHRADVLIVGGGPAGASCAWALRRHGLDVLVLDRATFPRLKLCAGWITPEVLVDLEVAPDDYPHALTTVTRLVVSVCGLRLPLSTRHLAIRRVEFDAWLLARSGARVVTHHAREIVRQEGGYVVDGKFFGRYLVGAGGTHCPVARTFFAGVNPRPREALIVTQEEEFRYPHASDGRGDACHLWFLERGLPGYAWYVPKAGGVVNVGVGGKAATLKARGMTIREHWAHLVATLDAWGLVRGYDFAPQGHAYYVRQGQPQLQVGNAFVVGDAAGLATQDMGEGIAPAVRSGLLVAETIATGEPLDVRRLRRWSQPRLIGGLLARAYG
ncbi:MAG: NAD(P)/FAD-dependent oxidoreductase [Anaerolineae bacterium]